MSGSETTILPYAPQHLDGFRAAVDAVAREKRWLSFTQAPPLASTVAFTEGMLAAGNPFYVALDGDTVVGWCDIAGSDRHTQAHIGTLGIGLLPPYRSKGIGRRLMQTALDSARRRGFERITLHVHANNTPARNLYEKLGFRFEGVMRKAFKVDDYYDDVVVMGLLYEEVSSLA